ncbi:MAG: mechanosensitive ion channel family protein [Actinomycetes bacterium]
MDWLDSVQRALTDVLTFIPKLVAFFVILLIGWIVAKALRNLADKVLERVGFDRAVERGGIRAALERSRYDASDIVAKIVYYAVLLFTLQLAFGVFGPNPISELLTRVVAFLPKIFVAVVIVVVAAAIANAVRDLISGTLGGTQVGRVLATGAWVLILALGVIAALNQVDVATTVTTPILIAFLATVGGVIVVGAGGGLIKPMQHRWERWLEQADEQAREVRAQTAANDRGTGAHAAAVGPTSAPTASYETAAGAPTTPTERDYR